MANIKDNKKGFKVIQISRKELVEELGQYGAIGICDYCNETASTGYYIAVLNQWFCPKCYQEWYHRATYYPEDAKVENRNFEFYKNIFGPEAEQKAETMLKKVRLEAEMDKKPDAVSGGQAQRASIARALATDPQMIFLDEPTAALDPLLTGEVLRVIQELKGSGKDFIFVTHELKFLKNFADYILFMDQGKIVEKGSVECLDAPQMERLKNFVEGEL